MNPWGLCLFSPSLPLPRPLGKSGLLPRTLQRMEKGTNLPPTRDHSLISEFAVVSHGGHFPRDLDGFTPMSALYLHIGVERLSSSPPSTIPAMLPPQSLAFAAFGLAQCNAPLLALGDKVTLFLGVAQNSIPRHSLPKPFEQALWRFSASQFDSRHSFSSSVI